MLKEPVKCVRIRAYYHIDAWDQPRHETIVVFAVSDEIVDLEDCISSQFVDGDIGDKALICDDQGVIAVQLLNGLRACKIRSFRIDDIEPVLCLQ